MGYKLLFPCCFLLALGSTAASASQYPGSPMVEALRVVGTPYRYGGASEEGGFDCSGLVVHAYERAWGVVLPRRTTEQRRLGKAVRRGELEPGDLVFYHTRNRPYSHVGIYIGDGRFVHAPKPGARVRLEEIDNPYWRARFNGGRRIER